MSPYTLSLCNHHKYHVKSKKYRNIKCTVDLNRKEKCILHVIAQNKNKDHLSAIAKNLNANNPCIVLENIKLVAKAKKYLPSTSEITAEIEAIEHESIHNNISTNNDKNSSESLIDISSVNTFGCREDNLYVPFSQSKGLQKKNFCYYCKKFQSKIARHLENVHKLEPEVKKFLLLPKGNLERKKIIETIRRKGNFIYNTDPSINTGKLIVCRRPAKNSRKTVRDFICCAKCKGWFTKNNIRHHFKQCANVSKGRSIQVLGRAVMGRIHECASETIADKYVRFLIRGKLERTVPVILDVELVQCIELILKYRQDANVPKRNPYVFGIPSKSKRFFKYLRACTLMRNFSKKCGAQIPHALRGTELRKHIATTCITLDLSENEVTDLANFMGHHEKIHKRHYRQSIPAVEIIRMTKFLQAALGEDVSEQSNNNSEKTIQRTSTDTSSEESESDIETCTVNLRESFSVQSENEFPETYITQDRQEKFKNKRKVVHKNHATVNNYNDSDEIPKKKKRRSTSPFGITKRKRWTEEERNTIFKEFQEEITISQLPSSKKIFHVKEKNKCLVNRSVAQIKTWIHNYISGKIKRN